MTTAIAPRYDNIDRYMAEISKHPVLDRDEEVALAYRYRDEGDITAAHKLVVSNLRFVVRIAHQYKNYGFNLTDLIQEGNVGLMMAVKKFDPSKGYRLISYAVWWIRAQIRAFVVRSWSLVKMGTTYAQRKLFFSRRSLSKTNPDTGEAVSLESLADELGLESRDIADMELRLAARDFSLDGQVGEDGRASHLDLLSDESPSQEDGLVEREQHQLLRGKVSEAMETLSEKERYIVENRLLVDEPATLQDIGDHFSVSRERVRQLETRVIKKLRSALDKANGDCADAA